MAINFDKYAQEGNLFSKELAGQVGHPVEIARTGIVLRAVLLGERAKRFYRSVRPGRKLEFKCFAGAPDIRH
jgi:hypothetical protein